MQTIKNFLKSSSIYFMGQMLSKIMVVLLLPIYTKMINPADYGYYDLVNTCINIISTLIYVEIWTGALRYILDYAEEKKKYIIINNSLFLFIVLSILAVIVVIVVNKFLPIEYAGLVLIYTITLCMQNIYGNIARGVNKGTVYAISGIIYTFCNIFLNILFLVFLKMDYSSLYISAIISSIIQCIIIEINVKIIKNFKYKDLNVKLMKKLISFSFPYCINTIAFWFLNSYAKIAISSNLSVENNGYFSIAAKFPMVLQLFASCFSLAWQEIAFSKKGTKEELSKFYSEFAKRYVEYISLIVLILIPVIKIIFPIFIDSQYNEAQQLIPLYLVSMAISILCSFITTVFGAIKVTKSLFVSSLISGIVNVIIIHLLIGKIGLMAANISMLIGFITNIVIRKLVLTKYIYVEFNFIKNALYFVPLFIVLLYIYNNCNFIINIIALILIMMFSIFKERKDILTIINYIKERKVKKNEN